jgi:hypothetical protein
MSDDWVYGAYIVQNEINQRPRRNRGNISPHTLCYGQPPLYSYSSILGKAYCKAETEFGLRLGKKVLIQVGINLPNELVP